MMRRLYKCARHVRLTLLVWLTCRGILGFVFLGRELRQLWRYER